MTFLEIEQDPKCTTKYGKTDKPSGTYVAVKMQVETTANHNENEFMRTTSRDFSEITPDGFTKSADNNEFNCLANRAGFDKVFQPASKYEGWVLLDISDPASQISYLPQYAPTGTAPLLLPATAPVEKAEATTGVTAVVTTTTKSASGVLAPTEIGYSKNYGIETSILSVTTEGSNYGPLTVFTIQLNNSSDDTFDGYNFPTPTVTYGESGLPAKTQFSSADGFGDGVQGSVPPGSRQTVKYAYDVDLAELNPAVVTIGSIVWKGDFSAFSR
ncbi:hypothetical protein ACMTN4_07620 [Rhodococcus globerulus]|uniref:hypothetical protein n=1 Tax=Rhodococcus globerulus TaxID=33008 RepID=UPI0039E8FDA3